MDTETPDSDKPQSYIIAMVKNIFLATIVLLSGLSLRAGDYTRFVNPFIGTQTDETGALSGSTFPGASLPQGMVQLSPDTELMVTWDPCSGYDYNKDRIYAFTHTHLSGTGCTDLIDISLMPVTWEVTPGYLKTGDFGQAYSHDAEAAHPGYYMVELKDSGVKVELSATTRVGIHRYSFPEGKPCSVILDLDHSTFRGEAYYTGKRAYDIIQSQVRLVDDHTVEGFRIITGWARMRKVYFRAEFSKPVRSHLFTDGGRDLGSVDVINGRSLKCAFDFDGGGEPLVVKVAISPVDSDGARFNMAAEARGWDFDSFAEAADREWDKALSCIDIEGSEKQKTIFYTGLYHVLLQPNTMSDADGRYMNTNFEIDRMPEGLKYYSTFSLWDTFRAAHPLYLLLEPEITASFVNSMVLHHKSYGYLPIWALWGEENYCMIGNHAIPVLSDAILAGLPGIDPEACYKAMVESSVRNHRNSPFDIWEKYGYMPDNLQATSVSITLEQAFDDWCVAAVAKKLGREDDYARFHKRSEFYRNLFDPSTGFFRPKDDKGEWVSPFDPLSYEERCFIEGNAWQYMWFVPQNPQGLIDLLGGTGGFLKKLDENFSLTEKSGETNGNASGFIGQYAHGNEPSHHTVYLYNFAGRHRRTQELIDQVRTTFYNDTPSGYAGNDDCGQMSAWYIFNAMGFYPFNAGSAEYELGTPLFPKTVIHLANGKDFTIIARNKTDKAIYVKNASLDGERLKEMRISHQDILNGGTLVFDMGKKGN